MTPPSLADDRMRLEKIDGRWRVSVAGVVVGHVLRAPHAAWSYAPWIVQGETRTSRGGVSARRRKLLGFESRELAARELARLRSGLVVLALCASDPPDPMFVMDRLEAEAAEARRRAEERRAVLRCREEMSAR